MTFLDAALSRCLERTEGAVSSSFVAVRQRLYPQTGATWRDIGGTYAIFDGADSPLSQTFGLGLFGPATDALDAIEAFFTERGCPTHHELSPLAGVETSALLVARGYRPIEHSSVLVRELGDEPGPETPLVVRTIDPVASSPSERARFVETSVEGWSDDPATAAFMRPLAEVASENPAMLHFLAEDAGRAIATGSLGLHDGIALLAGASTVPSARGRGAQSALLAARFQHARARGCTHAMMVTAPGSTSQRNAERSGFRVAYTRTKWQRLPG